MKMVLELRLQLSGQKFRIKMRFLRDFSEIGSSLKIQCRSLIKMHLKSEIVLKQSRGCRISTWLAQKCFGKYLFSELNILFAFENQKLKKEKGKSCFLFLTLLSVEHSRWIPVQLEKPWGRRVMEPCWAGTNPFYCPC